MVRVLSSAKLWADYRSKPAFWSDHPTSQMRLTRWEDPTNNWNYRQFKWLFQLNIMMSNHLPRVGTSKLWKRCDTVTIELTSWVISKWLRQTGNFRQTTGRTEIRSFPICLHGKRSQYPLIGGRWTMHIKHLQINESTRPIRIFLQC